MHKLRRHPVRRLGKACELGIRNEGEGRRARGKGQGSREQQVNLPHITSEESRVVTVTCHQSLVTAPDSPTLLVAPIEVPLA